MVAPSCPRDLAVDNNSAGPLSRQYDGADGARPENGMHLHCKYDLLVPEELEGG